MSYYSIEQMEEQGRIYHEAVGPSKRLYDEALEEYFAFCKSIGLDGSDPQLVGMIEAGLNPRLQYWIHMRDVAQDFAPPTPDQVRSLNPGIDEG